MFRAMKKEERMRVYQKYDGHCAYCGKEIAYKDMQVDHINPLYRGWVSKPANAGTDDMENYNPSCRSCNFRKRTYTIEQFRTELKRQCDGIIKRSFQVRQSMDYGLLEYHDRPIIFYFERFNKEQNNERNNEQRD